MGIINRRNAVLGWAAWQAGKRVAARKARSEARRGTGSSRAKKGAIVSAVAAVGGALWFLRRRRGGDESAKPSTPPADEKPS
ncbi:MAG TPA: hypothetical protein VFO03_12610 [Gaiellaceae bacterium]|nr:hypothetical protein [Gaiellaceae bacterium]